MTVQEDNINLGKFVFDDSNQKRKSWACLGQTCSRSLFMFSSNLLWFCWLSLADFGEIIFQKFVTNPLFGWEFCAVQQDTFYTHKNCEQINFYKKSSLYIIGRSLRDGKVTTYLQLAQKWNLSTKNWPNLLCSSTHSDTLWCYAKRDWKSGVCSRCKLWINGFLKEQRYKILVNFSRFKWRVLQFERISWYCHHWKKS